jgi:tetratricopeptide (TPR) repeat protein
MRILPRVLLLFLTAGLFAQSGSAPDGRQISGQVRMGQQSAVAGVPVILQIVGGKYVTPANEPETARTVTDAKGRFVFEHLENLKNNGREFFAVSVKLPGYTSGFQVVDLTLVARGEVTLNVQKETARSQSPFAAAAPSGPRHSTSLEVQHRIDLAEELLFRKRDPEAAIDDLKLAIKGDPWYSHTYLLLGLANMQLQRWAEAQLAFSEAAKVDPGNVQAYLGQGSALNEQRDYPAAQKALQQALDLNPNSAEAHYELARTFCALEKWDAAGPHARRAIEINPDYSGPHVLMANIYMAQQDMASARRELQEYLKLDPDDTMGARPTLAELDKALAEKPKRR